MRYLLASQILKLYQAPIILADLDQTVVSDLDPLLATAQGSDISTLRFQGMESNIFGLFSATVLIINPTPGGIAFSECLTRNASSALSNSDHMVWHLDQGILAIAQFALRDKIRIGSILPSMVHLIPDTPPPPGSAILWSVTSTLSSDVQAQKIP